MQTMQRSLAVKEESRAGLPVAAGELMLFDSIRYQVSQPMMTTLIDRNLTLIDAKPT